MQKALIGLLLLALVLRLPGLSDSFWLDEAAQALESVRPWHQQLSIVQDFQPPLLHLLLHLVLYISIKEAWLRLWGAILPGILTIWVTYECGKKIASKKVGLLAAALLATSSFHVFYSQELRPYALTGLWSALSWLVLLRWEKQTKGQQLLFILFSTLGLYSTYLYPFVMMSQALYVALQSRKHIKRFTLQLAVSLLAFLPWLPMFWAQLRAGQQLRLAIPGWETVVSSPQLKALPLVFGKFIYGVINLELSWQFALLPLLLILSGVFLFAWQPTLRPNFKRKSLYAASCWLIGSIVGAWLISFVVPVLQPKRVLFALPASYLLASYILIAFTELRSTTATMPAVTLKQRLGWAGIALLLGVNIWGLTQYYGNPLLRREDWRGLMARIQSQCPREESIAVFAFPDAFAPFKWYGNEYPYVASGVLTTEEAPNLSEQLELLVRYKNVLVFDYLRDLTDPNDKVLQVVEDYGYREAGLLDTPNIGFVRVYARY